MSKITTELANAARRLLPIMAAETLLSAEAEISISTLRNALEAFDDQQLAWIDFRTRMPDEKLAEILREELEKDGMAISTLARVPYLAGMRRVADYADHLRGLMKALADNADLVGVIYQVREQEMLGWEGPKVIAYGDAVAGILAELKAAPNDG